MSQSDYQRVVDDISARIAANVWRPGHELPSYRQLAEQFEVSVSTVNRALAVLRALGLVEGRQGKGTFVAERHGPAGVTHP